jgi:hypothetical protein
MPSPSRLEEPLERASELQPSEYKAADLDAKIIEAELNAITASFAKPAQDLESEEQLEYAGGRVRNLVDFAKDVNRYVAGYLSHLDDEGEEVLRRVRLQSDAVCGTTS